MIEAGALIVFVVVFLAVAVLSDRYSPLIGIGGLLVLLGVARTLLP